MTTNRPDAPNRPDARPGSGLPTNPNTRKLIMVFTEVIDSNGNGDPDLGGGPRCDIWDHGKISHVSIKRKYRTYWKVVFGHDLYMAVGADLGQQQEKYNGKAADVKAACIDTRLFGGVLTQCDEKKVTGPISVTNARSMDPVDVISSAITRVAGQVKKGVLTGTMARQQTVAYGLYEHIMFYSPSFAQKTGVTDQDLADFWDATIMCHEESRSANRNQVNVRHVIVFDYGSERGNTPGYLIQQRVTVTCLDPEGRPSKFSDYRIDVDLTDLPPGMTVSQWIDGRIVSNIQLAAK